MKPKITTTTRTYEFGPHEFRVTDRRFTRTSDQQFVLSFQKSETEAVGYHLSRSDTEALYQALDAELGPKAEEG